MLPSPASPHARRVAAALTHLAAFGGVVVLWEGACRFGLVSPFLLPAPERVAAIGLDMLADGTLVRHTAVSLARAMAGFLLAVMVALPLAVLLSLAPRPRRLLEPLLEFLRQIPPLALIPLLVLWLGIGEAQKLGVVALTCFFPVFLGTLGGLAQVDRKLVEVGRVCGLAQSALVSRIILPAAMPSIVTGLRISLGFSWRALVGAELIAASEGLGYLIVDAQNMARTDVVLVGVVVIGLLGMLVDRLTRMALHRAMPWLPRDGGADA